MPHLVVGLHPWRMGDFTQNRRRMCVYRRGMSHEAITVLVVDDHALHRDGTRRILEAQPDLVVVGDVDSGEAALDLVRELSPAVVLMDIRLPGINGIEATRRIIEDHDDVRVLIVTAYDDDEYVRGAVQAGASGCVSKAAPGQTLVDAVRTVAAGGSVLAPGMLTRLVTMSQQPERSSKQLSDRELEVLRLLAAGMRNREIGVELAISARTVDRHCDGIYAKLGVFSRTEAVVKGLSMGLVDTPGGRT